MKVRAVLMKVRAVLMRVRATHRCGPAAQTTTGRIYAQVRSVAMRMASAGSGDMSKRWVASAILPIVRVELRELIIRRWLMAAILL